MALKIMKAVLLLSISILGSLVCTSSRIYLTKSRWVDRQVLIDGKAEEWKGTQAFLEKEQLFVSFLNDRESLYICLVASRNPTGDLIMRQGLTVWFDPKGGNSKTFGIKYPQAVPFGERSMDSEKNRQEDINENMPKDILKELEILRPENKEPEKVGVDWAKDQGLEVNAALSSGLFVYELKIPFLASEGRPWAIGAQPGAQVGIGIESTAVYQRRPPEEAPGEKEGERTEGRGDMGGRAGRGGGGRGEFNAQPNLAKSLKCWLVIQLAQEKTISQPNLLSVTD